MTEIEELIERIENRANGLMDRCDVLESEKHALLEQTAGLNQTLEQKQDEIAELEKRNQMLQVAGSLGGDVQADNYSAKQKINELVREIDKCIALLNK